MAVGGAALRKQEEVKSGTKSMGVGDTYEVWAGSGRRRRQ